MKSIAFWFIALASLFALAGMVFGVWMSATQDHTLAGAHGHNNLIGWVTLALYGFFYLAVPAAGKSRVALVHFWAAVVGAVGMGPGIAMAIQGQGEIVVQVASILSIIAMVLFAWQVFTNRSALGG